MKRERILAASFPLIVVSLFLAMNKPAPNSITVYPRATPMQFAIASWDAPNPAEGVAGYYIYLSDQPNALIGKVKLDLQVNLHGITQVPVLLNHPVTYASVSAYGADGRETARSNEDHYP